jgi:hypothetical protein
MIPRLQSAGYICARLVVTVLACASFASASATLFLEEPYGKLGFFTATGHAAVYLSGVCAETPVVLRPCRPGETGVVISRYDGVDHYDWVAIPVVPYLYAVDRAEDAPLFADARMVAFLRDSYRRKYLEAIAPDGKNGETPGGNWYELVGSSYDRTIYGFQIETTPAQDAALIRKLNAAPNRSHFRTVSKNCADFAKDIINFYYPKALHRSVVADVGITTPKQMAKTLVKFKRRHSELEYSHFIIAQVPGSTPRSSAVHGVVESFFKSKKYMVPSAVASPIFAGCVFAVYEGVGAGRFQPGRDALILDSDGTLEQPIGHEDLRAFQQELKDLLASEYPVSGGLNVEKNWSRVESRARTEFDDHGRPVLEMQENGRVVRIGLSVENVLNGSAASPLVRELLEARLQSELRSKAAHEISEDEVTRDWDLLQQAGRATNSALTANSTEHNDSSMGGDLQ